jgi:proline racemase
VGNIFTTIDCHTAGEPLRVITGGVPDIPGDTIMAKRRFAEEHLDGLRRVLMWEPRGHSNMYGCIPVDPVTEDGDLGVLFLHNDGFSTMCGHGIIGIVKVGLEYGLIAAVDGENVVRIDTPAGRVTARAEVRDGRVGAVTFANVPSFLLDADVVVDAEGIGEVVCDIAFGGAFYAYVDAAELEIPIDTDHSRQIIHAGMAIKRAVTDQIQCDYPGGDPDLNFLYGTILVEPVDDGHVHSRNACVFADRELDRCPTGTGVSGRAAIHHARGELMIGESMRIASIIGSTFEVRPTSETIVGGIRAIVPEVTGEAFLTGRHEFVVDDDDPLRGGFLVR